MYANFVKWMSPNQIPHVQWTPKTGFLSRYALGVPCVLGNRTGTCNLYVTKDDTGREDGSFTEIDLPAKHQEDAPDAYTFTLEEVPSSGETTIKGSLVQPVDLVKLVRDMMVKNSNNVVNAEGIDQDVFLALFPFTKDYT